MRAELWNLSLFALAIGKTLLMTGLLPAILFVYVAETWASAFRVPARKLFGKVVSRGQSKAETTIETETGSGLDGYAVSARIA